MRGFDYKLAFYCAPTFAGVKPANLLSIQRGEWSAIKNGLIRSGRRFGSRQIYFRRLKSCDHRILLLVYRRDLLADHIALPENRRILERYGYNTEMMADTLLVRLAKRIRQADGFPHEIGVFLGYPPEDVNGFIEHGGKNYRFCGYWKVYGDPAKAKRLFSAYEHARCFFSNRVLDGEVIENIQYGGIA